MIKLNYRTIEYKDLKIHYAKYRKNRSIRLTVNSDGTIKLTCPYFISNDEILNFIKDKESWIRKAISKIQNTTKLSNFEPLNTRQKKELYLRICVFVNKYEMLLNTKVQKFTIRKMKTLWGSCSYLNKCIRFNSMLYYMSDDFLEYIVLHEITHIFVHNHSKEFYAIIKKYMPNYKKIWSEHKKVSLR